MAEDFEFDDGFGSRCTATIDELLATSVEVAVNGEKLAKQETTSGLVRS